MATPIKVVVDYAPAKGKRSPCQLDSCGKVIERGELRIKEEYQEPPVEGGEAALKYHLECYPQSIDMEKLEGVDKLQEKDKEKQKGGSEKIEKVDKVEKEKEDENENDQEKEKEKEKEKQKQKEKVEVAQPAKEKETETHKDESKAKPAFKNGSKVMAKVHSNVSKNNWFPAKVISSRVSAVGVLEYHVTYTEEIVKDLKEWVPEKFVSPLINQDIPAPASSLTTGTLGIGWRRKPGGQVGWWHTVKVLRYLNDVPGAYVHWMDFPFPDSILEAGKVYPIKLETKTETPPVTGVKRPLEEENDSISKKEKVT